MYLRLIALAALLLTAVSASAQTNRADMPNVVLMFIDDLGYGDVGPFGCKDIPTPHLDRLADEGIVLTQSYVTNPPCCPSRASLVMGMYGQNFGKYGMSRGLPIPKDKPTMAEFMRDHGYVTGQIGKWDLGSPRQGPSARGFMEVAHKPPKGDSKFFCKTESGGTAWLTDVNGDQMVEFIERNKARPFFMYWSPEAVHSPHTDAPARLTQRTRASGNRRKLGGGIVSVDDQLGKLLATLERLQLRENTLIIFSSDNGGNPSEGGSSTPYRGGKGEGTQQVGWTLIPTVMSWPGTIPRGKRYHGISCTLDFYATMAGAIGKSAPKHLDGVNLIPYLRGEKRGDAHEYLFWLNNQPDDAKRRWLVATRWKQYRLYKYKERDDWQLFDLAKDPKEKTDLAAKLPEVVKNMAAEHKKWKKTLAPPGTVPKKGSATPIIETGHGWTISDGNLRPTGNVVAGTEKDRDKKKDRKRKN
jgi:arylsulfatase A-like enzyme